MKARAFGDHAFSLLKFMGIVAVLAIIVSLMCPRYVLGDATLRLKVIFFVSPVESALKTYPDMTHTWRR